MTIKMDKAYLVTGFLAVLFLCSVVDGYFYIYGDTNVLPGEKAHIEVCGGWDESITNVDLAVYKIDTGSIYEFAGSENNAATLKGALSTTPVFKRTIKNLDGCESVELPVLDRGMYAIYGKSGKENETAGLLVSKLGIVTKSWTEDKNGETLAYAIDLVSGQPVEGVSLKLYWDGKLKASGSTDSDGLFNQPGLDEGSLVVIGQKGDDLAIVSPYYYYGYGGETSKTYLYTDRPVYRPSQDVYFKAITWKVNGGAYSIPNGTARIQIKDPKGNVVYDKNMTINDFGSISGKFKLSDEPPLGYYGIAVEIKDLDTGYGNFQVEEYKKPEYQVSVTMDREQYVSGDTMNADITATYYFGSPVVDADVEYTIRKSDWWSPCWGGYRCYYAEDIGMRPYYYGETVTTGTGKTGADGKFRVTLVPQADRNSIYTIEAKVTDKSRREVTSSASATVSKGEFDFYITTDRWSYEKGDHVRINVKSIDINDKPVSAFGKLTIEQHEWDRGYSKEKVTTILKQDVETSSSGEAVIDFVPDVAGSFYITINGTDARGNEISADGYFYVSDERPRWDYWSQLDVKLDRDAYEAGDTAKVTIESPVANFAVLVTVEGPKLYEHYVKTFNGTTGSLEIPVKAEYEPNVDIYAIVVANMTQYSQSARLILPPEEKFLNVDIITNKESYMPRDEAVFTIVTKDNDGNPVAAELSLGVVDESIYAIVEESTEEIEKFFYGLRWSSVSTQNSWTGYGRVLEETAAGAVQSASAPSANIGLADRAMKSGEGGLVTPQTRKYFPDTAFWHAHVTTDSSGRATVRVTMPDSLTTWRATARAVDKSFRVGQNTDKVITRKNLVVRMETPRFLTQNDELLVSAVVHNYLKNTKEVVVELNATGVDVIGETTQTISVAPGADERVDWQVTANSCCKANFTVRALTNEESDAMETLIPILPHGIEEQDSWAGSISDSSSNTVTKNIIVPDDSIYSATNLSIMISPSIASTAFDALEYLATYPYGCVEQTMSAFLPDVYVSQVLKSLDINNDKLEKELPDMVSKGLQNLYKLQHSDGGWGWWENDETHPYMTAYVVYGLTQAKKAGFAVDSNVLANGLRSLKEQYASGSADANTMAYMAYALSFHEKPTSYPKDEKLSDYGKALKTLAMLNTGESTTFPTSLDKSAICDEIMCHWSAETFHYSWNSNDIETTSYVLMALIKTNPNSNKIEPAVRWLVSKRHGRRWESTKDTATAVFALAEYLKISRELSPNYVAKIYLNGELVKSVKKDDAFDMDNEISLSPKTGTNELRIVKEGSGKLYYAIFLRYFKEEENIKAKSSGITVKRTYNTTGARSGDYIRVNLSIDVPSDLEYIILEDPIPAGCEVVEEPQSVGPYWEYGYYWSYWYSEREVRDEKVVYFMTYLHPGKNEISYTLRAEVPGSYHVMPATAWNMYDENIRGHSDENQIQINDKLVVRIGEVVVGDNSVDFTVNALKLAKEELSGEVVIQVKDLQGGVLKEVKEYISIKESSYNEHVSVSVSLNDGAYVISYTITTSGGDIISGSKRVQVGQIPEVIPPVITPETPRKAAGNEALILVAALVLIVAVFLGLRYFRKK